MWIVLFIMIVLIIFFLCVYQRCSPIFYWQGEQCLYDIIVVTCCLFICIYMSLACLESRSWKRWWHSWHSRLLFITSRAYQWVFQAIFFIILRFRYRINIIFFPRASWWVGRQGKCGRVWLFGQRFSSILEFCTNWEKGELFCIIILLYLLL